MSTLDFSWISERNCLIKCDSDQEYVQFSISISLKGVTIINFSSDNNSTIDKAFYNLISQDKQQDKIKQKNAEVEPRARRRNLLS